MKITLVWLTLFLSLVLILPSLTQEAQTETLVARQITLATAADDLFSGSDADGGIGDWRLSNGIVEAIIDNIGFQEDVLETTGQMLPIQNQVAPSGGILIDLGLVGHHNDQFDSMFQLVNFSADSPIVYLPASMALNDPALPPIIATVDEEAGRASLTVQGVALVASSTVSNPTVPVITEYSLRRGEDFMRIKTTITNKTSRAIPLVSIIDAIVMANRGNLPFAVSPDRGFHHSELDISNPFDVVGNYPYVSIIGRVSPDDGIADTVDMVPAGEVSYTLLSPQSEFLFGVVSDLTAATGSPLRLRPLPSGREVSYERRIIVGERNDVASGSDQAVQQLSPVYDFPTGMVRGRLVPTDGLPFRASLEVNLTELVPSASRMSLLARMVNRADNPLPLTHMKTDSETGGQFHALLPAGQYQLVFNLEARAETPSMEFTVSPGETTELGDIDLQAAGHLVFQVSDPSTTATPAKITIKGRNGTPDPHFGLPLKFFIDDNLVPTQAHHASPALNIVYTADGQGEVVIRPGDYRVYASRGLEYEIDAQDVSIAPGETERVSLHIENVVDTRGYLSGDFHIHGLKSPDSSVPPIDRVLSFAAEGVQVMVSTDHDFIFDYQPVIQLLGLEDVITSMTGSEVTTSQPSGSSSFGIGHFNGWPLPVQSTARRHGSPEDEFVEPNVIYDRLRRSGADVVQLNHPQSSNGMFDILGYDPSLGIEEAPNDFLLRESILGTGTRNVDYDVMEIYNGKSVPQYLLTRLSWFSLLNQGIMRTGTAVTDTHLIALSHAGFPRTYVAYRSADLGRFDPTRFNNNLKAMNAFGTSGPFLDVRAVAPPREIIVGPGATISAPEGLIILHVRIQAPSWIPVQQIRVFANGELIRQVSIETPSDEVVRFDGEIELQLDRDSYYVVEAGQRLPEDPTQQPAANELMSIIVPGVASLAFSNPIFADFDGNGLFDPPGLEPFMTGQRIVWEKLKQSVVEPYRHLDRERKRFEMPEQVFKEYLKSLGYTKFITSGAQRTVGWRLLRPGPNQ